MDKYQVIHYMKDKNKEEYEMDLLVPTLLKYNENLLDSEKLYKIEGKVIYQLAE